METSEDLRFIPRIRLTDGRREIFCAIRKKFLTATPEEFVRQELLYYLIQKKAYPRGLLAVEKALKVNGMNRRTDAVAFAPDLSPLLICECKAPHIKIDQHVFDQAAAYNATLNAKALLVTNGATTFSALFDYANRKYHFFRELPSYKELVEMH